MKKLKLKRIILPILSIVGASTISAITLSSCGVSSTILNNLVDKWAKNGDFSSGTNNTGLSFNDVVQQAALNKTGSTAFKNSVANEIAYNFYKNIVDGKYNNLDKKTYKDNWDKWTKQTNDDYKAKIKEYKTNHKYDWPYYFQNEVLDPVGGTEANWKKYDSSKGMCQYIVKDLTTRAKANNYMGIAANASDAAYTYHWNDQVKGNTNFNDDGQHNFFESGQTLDAKYWNFIDFYARVQNPRVDAENYLEEFWVALQREAFYEWLDRYQPISTSSVLWKYSAPSNNGRNLATIYNTTETAPSYALPYFDDAAHDPTKKSTNEIFDSMWRKGFDYATSGHNGSFLWNSSIGNYGNLGLMNVDAEFNDSKTSTMSLMSIDKYSSFSEFNGPAINALWNSNITSTPIDNMWSDQLKRTYEDNTGADAPPRILGNFLFSNDVTNRTKINLPDFYGTWDNTPAASGGIAKIYNHLGNDNEIKKYNYANNAVQLRTSGTVRLPYILYRGDDGVHLVGLDGADYLKSNNTNLFDGSNGFITTNIVNTRARENALLKFRAMYEQYATNPIAGTGLKIQDAYKAYLDSNFSDVLINTFYRTTLLTTPQYWFNNANDPDDHIDWKFDIDNFDKITSYLNATTKLFEYQDLISKYDDANKKLLSFGKKYADNMTNADNALKNGLAIALPWMPVSGTVPSDNNIKNLHTHYAENSYFLEKFSSAGIGTLEDLETDVTSKFDLWRTARNDVVFDNAKSNYEKYSEHITCKNHFAADMLWAAMGDSSSKMSNLQRYKIYDAYLTNNGANPVDVNGKYLIERDYGTAITSQYISSKLMVDDTSLPSYVNDSSEFSGNSAQNLTKFNDILNDRWNAKSKIDQTWADHTSGDYISYLNFLARLKWLTTNNAAGTQSNFMDYLQQQNGLNSTDPLSMLNSPNVIAWIDKDDFGSNKNVRDPFDFKKNYNNQFENQYTNTNNTSTPPARSWASFSQYWQYAKLEIDKTPTGTDNSVGMGFVGLQTKGKLNGLPDDAATQVFDNFITSARTTGDFIGSLYRFGSTPSAAADNIKKLLSIGNITALSNFFDNALPDELTTTGGVIENWSQCKNLMSIALDQTSKLNELKFFLLGGTNPLTGATKGILDPLNTPAFAIISNLVTGYNGNQANANATLFPYNGQEDSYAFGDSDVGTKVAVKQINFKDVASQTALTTAIGRDAADALIVQLAMTTNNDIKITLAICDSVFGAGKKLEVFDRRFNDDADLRNWLQDYKSTN